MADVQMISPPVFIYAGEGEEQKAITVYGWLTEMGVPITPIVANPDGPGVGTWHLYYGEDPWTAS